MKRLALLIVVFSFYSGLSYGDDAIVKIHYLGHSAFVLQFDNGINIVTDYGHYNAWVDWGWDSPIHDINELVPDVMTYSHTNHEDHYDPDRIPEGVGYILTEYDSLVIEGIHIKPVRTCESSIDTESNSSYIFTYKDLKICHLGDAQAQIMRIGEKAVCDHIVDIFPKTFDLLLMTVEGTQQFVEEVEIFVDVLKPKRIILMHYWSDAYKKNVIRHLDMQNFMGKNYQIIDYDGPKYTLSSIYEVSPVRVINLQRAPFEIETSIRNEIRGAKKFNLEQNYPNPFNPKTIINYELPISNFVDLSVYNLLGEKVTTLVSERQNIGAHSVEWNAIGMASGVYHYVLQAGEFQEMKRMVVLK